MQTVFDALLPAMARRYTAPPRLSAPDGALAGVLRLDRGRVLSEPLADGYRSYLAGKLESTIPALGLSR